MTFKVLQSDDILWSNLINTLPHDRRDIHFLPEYGRIYEDVYRYKARLAVWQDSNGFIIQPFVLRPVHELPFLEESGNEEFYDFSHPYGYGGPMPSSDAMADCYKDFNEAFHQFCLQERYASEFCSLHPLLVSIQKPLVENLHMLNYQKDIFSVDLNGSLLDKFSQGHRRNYRKAEKAGVEVTKVDINSHTLAQFQEIYIYTMNRHGAADRWHFPDDYFPACHTNLSDKEASLFFAHYGGQLASACFLIHAFDTAYYHFGGSYEHFHEVRASNKLMTEAMLWAQAAGYRQFHMGGGVSSSPDDPLVKFKKGFGANSYPLFSYEKTHNREVYDRLCALKLEHEHKTLAKTANNLYFPLYRR